MFGNKGRNGAYDMLDKYKTSYPIECIVMLDT